MKKILLLFVLTIFVNACTTTKVVPVETVRVDSVYVSKMQRDSIFMRDSIYLVERGDTVFKTMTKYVYRDRVLRDTVYQEKCDTITNVVEVERELSFWQKRKLELGGAAMLLLPVLLVVILLKR